MDLKCDVCSRRYEGDFDCHDFGELNICCEACLWELSHLKGEPKPKHTCSSQKAGK